MKELGSLRSGTLQASYTDFHYLRDVWRRTTERDALIGVSMTGIASGKVLNLDMTEAANIVKAENKRVADLLELILLHGQLVLFQLAQLALL